MRGVRIMKDKLFHLIDIIFYHFYRFIMGIIYKYKTMVICRDIVKISPNYKKAIRAYWKRYYRNISLSDFKWYQTKKNIKNIRLIPDTVYHSRIEPYFNDIKSVEAFSNKGYYSLFFRDFKVPYTIAKNMTGVYMDDDFNIISQNEVKKLCLNEEEILIKPSLDSGGGRNITFLQMNEEGACCKLETALDKYKKDFVIQRVVKQHEEINKLNSTSLNTVRIQSFLYKGNVEILSSFLRVGHKGSRIDNLSSGGLAIAINENGELNSFACDGDGNISYRLPNGYQFKKKKIPGFEEIVKSVKKLHPRFVNFGIIGWDIAVDEEGEPVFIEFNPIDTCIRNTQIVKGPLFGKLTDEVLKEVYGNKKR